MSDRRAINEYLYYAFGYDLQQDPSAIAEDWPFQLQFVGLIQSVEEKIEVFQFILNRQIHFVLSGSTLGYYPAAGMTLDDLQLQHDGSKWIAQQSPIGLATSHLGDPLVPSTTERRATIEQLAATVCASPRILEGLYLQRPKCYLALVEDVRTRAALIVGTGLDPRITSFPEASAWRRLAVGVGKMIKEGILK